MAGKFKITISDRDTGARELIKALGRATKAHARVGYFDKEKGAEDRGGLTNAQLGAIHEFGSPGNGIPERSHIRATFDTKRGELNNTLAKLARAIYGRKLTIPAALEVLGLKGESMIKKFITKGEQIPPPNSPRTLLKKNKLGTNNASPRTLVDTGRMVGSITSRVVK